MKNSVNNIQYEVWCPLCEFEKVYESGAEAPFACPGCGKLHIWREQFVICDCGRKVYLREDINTCQCGKVYKREPQNLLKQLK